MPKSDWENEKSAVQPHILRRLGQAVNAHDVDAIADCFTEDLRSDHPIHPARSFTGRERLRKNWTGAFAQVPDYAVRVLRCFTAGDKVWSELEMGGTTVAGKPSLSRGVVILQLRGECIASVRFYLESADTDLD